MNYGEHRASDQNTDRWQLPLQKSAPAYVATFLVFCFGLAGLLALVVAAVLAFGGAP
jgi:hypothetical protein